VVLSISCSTSFENYCYIAGRCFFRVWEERTPSFIKPILIQACRSVSGNILREERKDWIEEELYKLVYQSLRKSESRIIGPIINVRFL